MSRFIEGKPHSQSTLFPARIEEYICEDNSVRVIDAFVEGLDLVDLGFRSAQPQVTEKLAYHPAIMLKPVCGGKTGGVELICAPNERVSIRVFTQSVFFSVIWSLDKHLIYANNLR